MNISSSPDRNETMVVNIGHRDLPIFRTESKSILSPTTGFIKRAGFTHSLTPARNCTYGCSYCYVPTMRLQGGLKREDWLRWGHHTTYKSNAAELLDRQLRPSQIIYCSPMVDPYQPTEHEISQMPEILEILCEHPPAVFVLQTRGTLVLRDMYLLRKLAERTRFRISFSLTTDRDDIRKIYEPHCETIQERVEAMHQLTSNGFAVHCTLAPILPCNPVHLADLALSSTSQDVIADPLHQRITKPHGATTRPEALKISDVHATRQWHQPEFQRQVLETICTRIKSAGRCFGVGEDGFRMLTR